MATAAASGELATDVLILTSRVEEFIIVALGLNTVDLALLVLGQAKTCPETKLVSAIVPLV